MNKDQRLTRLALLGLIPALTSCAGTTHKAAPSLFSDADTNRDGRVSKAEFAEAKLRRVFNKLDLNGDQKITADEWKRFDNSPQAAAHFAALDENGDQYITVAEFLKLAPQHSDLDQIFQGMDRNADGSLSNDELQQDPAVRLFSISF
jgi:Ca2+-binding EF-hand superfamily protein